MDDKHWLSDVVFGSIVGYAIGKFTYKFNEEKTNFFIFPFYERKSFGILISLPSGISKFFLNSRKQFLGVMFTRPVELRVSINLDPTKPRNCNSEPHSFLLS